MGPEYRIGRRWVQEPYLLLSQEYQDRPSGPRGEGVDESILDIAAQPARPCRLGCAKQQFPRRDLRTSAGPKVGLYCTVVRPAVYENATDGVRPCDPGFITKQFVRRDNGSEAHDTCSSSCTMVRSRLNDMATRPAR